MSWFHILFNKLTFINIFLCTLRLICYVRIHIIILYYELFIYWTTLLLCLQQLAKAKNDVRDHEEIIKEKQQFLDNEIENNNEQEKRISIAERAAAKMRLDYQEAEAQRDQFQSEVRDIFMFYSEKMYLSTRYYNCIR